MEQVVGIEPTLPAWKAGVLPIYDTCILKINHSRLMVGVTGIEPATSTSQTSRAPSCATPRCTLFNIFYFVAVLISDKIYSTISFTFRQHFFLIFFINFSTPSNNATFTSVFFWYLIKILSVLIKNILKISYKIHYLLLILR